MKTQDAEARRCHKYPSILVTLGTGYVPGDGMHELRPGARGKLSDNGPAEWNTSQQPIASVPACTAALPFSHLTIPGLREASRAQAQGQLQQPLPQRPDFIQSVWPRALWTASCSGHSLPIILYSGKPFFSFQSKQLTVSS